MSDTSETPAPEAPVLSSQQIAQLVGQVAGDGATAGAISRVLVNTFEALRAEVATWTARFAAVDKAMGALQSDYEASQQEVATLRATAHMSDDERVYNLQQEVATLSGLSAFGCPACATAADHDCGQHNWRAQYALEVAGREREVATLRAERQAAYDSAHRHKRHTIQRTDTDKEPT